MTETSLSGESGDITVSETETVPELLDALPEDIDLEGTNVTFLLEEGMGGSGNYTEKSIWVEEDGGDSVDAAIFYRNIAVTDRLNAEISIAKMVEHGQASGVARQAVNAGSDDYSVVGVYQYYGCDMATTGMLFNLYNNEYIDVDKPYWDSDLIDSTTYKNVRPWVTGDLALRYLGGMYAMFVNSILWDGYYTGESIYDIVHEGNWTLDTLEKYANSVYEDKNGNGERDADDTYGFVFYEDDQIDAFAAGSNVSCSGINEEGEPYITVSSEHSINFIEKMIGNIRTMTGYYTYGGENGENMTKLADSTAMFTSHRLNYAELYLRDMDDDFWIIPLPKYDNAQQEYITRIHDALTLFGIPVSNKNPEAASIMLEAMSSESYRSVTPVYYETALKVKYARDAESGKMIDLIRENVICDFASMYSESLMDINHVFRKFIEKDDRSYASYFQKCKKIWESGLAKLTDKILAMEDNEF